MLKMQPFEVQNANSINDVLAALKKFGSGAKLCAGGSDLLPNIKHELFNPKAIINIANVSELRFITLDKNNILIGSGVTLNDICENGLIAKHAPGLKSAALYIASPQIRNVATVGGNICLDTRCMFYNQSYFWREALGFCLKKDGDICHVIKAGKRCVAASSNDLATMLISLDANLEIIGQNDKKTLPLRDFYVADGSKNNILEPEEFVSQISIPLPPQNLDRLEGFAKLRHRKSIDFPILSIGVCFLVDRFSQIKQARLTINALAAKPKMINCEWLNQKALNSDICDELASYAGARCKPLINISDDVSWRKQMVVVYIKKACLQALSTKTELNPINAKPKS